MAGGHEWNDSEDQLLRGGQTSNASRLCPEGRNTLVTCGLPSPQASFPVVWEMEQLAGLDSSKSTPESICACVAKIFEVRATEVALLELSGSLLNFLYPAELKTAGAIPLSSSAVAARTAQTKRAELFNGFTEVKHFSVFELVKLGDSGLDDQVIQKLMSAPVVTPDGEVIGVFKSPARRRAQPQPDRTSLPRIYANWKPLARFESGRVMPGQYRPNRRLEMHTFGAAHAGEGAHRAGRGKAPHFIRLGARGRLPNGNDQFTERGFSSGAGAHGGGPGDQYDRILNQNRRERHPSCSHSPGLRIRHRFRTAVHRSLPL